MKKLPLRCEQRTPSILSTSFSMWKLTSRFFLGLFATAMFTNAVAVYLLRDVDADRIGKWNLAFWELTQEFLFFSLVVAGFFLLFVWIGTAVLSLRRIPANPKLGFVLGVLVILIQYPAEFMVRWLTAGHSANTFLLSYLLVAPICCAAVILLNSRKRRLGS